MKTRMQSIRNISVRIKIISVIVKILNYLLTLDSHEMLALATIPYVLGQLAVELIQMLLTRPGEKNHTRHLPHRCLCFCCDPLAF